MQKTTTRSAPRKLHASELCLRQRCSLNSDMLFVLLLLLCMCCGFENSIAQKPPGTLPSQEIDTLKQIASKLKIGFWDFDVNPCTGLNGWLVNTTSEKTVKKLTCTDPDVNNTSHVVSILLKSQNLTGVLPTEFADLKSLVELDLTRNFINGSIPPEWGSLPRLFNLSLGGNRISGSIPREIGNITTLNSLVLENNLMNGSIPDVFGRMPNLTRLIISGNDFTGELPISMGKLTNLVDLRIDGSGISGMIPSFIGNLKKLGRIHMQGTSLRGPFPPEFSALVELFELILSDMKLVSFPPLKNMSKLNGLTLRNCSLSGGLPSYIGEMTMLSHLDLSFNNFTGVIPISYQKLSSSIENMYLTSNSLSGAIPKWILRHNEIIDLSYNNFEDSSGPDNCVQQGTRVNVFASHSSSQNTLLDSCFRKDFPCSPRMRTNDNLFINCGGSKVEFEKKEYEQDNAPLGASTFYLSPTKKWGFSSTGDYFNNHLDNSRENYIIERMDGEEVPLYNNARLSPNSLTYFGLCLKNKNYTVTLHFAEIIFLNDQSFLNSGRRFFDVSIQGQIVLKDFNIGIGSPVVKNFSVLVDSGTLEIRFRWSGKGSNSLIQKGVYGPIISAISVTSSDPDTSNSFTQKKKDTSNRRNRTLFITASTVASLTLVLISLILLWRHRRKERKANNGLENEDLSSLSKTQFSLKMIASATKNFDDENKIGKGGFGVVFKGILPEGTRIAVKKLSSFSSQGNQEFINEIGLISSLRHPNLVKILGCCSEGDQLLLVYEYMENNSLCHVLLGSERTNFKLDWLRRCNIVLGIAKGLAYLHEESRIKIVHRDIKSTNVLLDKDFNAKISDFGLAKLYDDRNSHITTRIAGTRGYMAPEYAMWGHLTNKVDVYSFGIVLLEVISGKYNIIDFPDKEYVYLPDWARDLQRSGNLLQLVDENLGSQYSQKEAIKMIELGLLCVSATSAIRPSMSEVVSVLEGGEFVGHDPSSINQEMRYADGDLSISKGKYHSQASTSIIQSYIDDLTR